MARHRGHRDHEPNYRRRIRWKLAGFASLVVIVALIALYVTFDAFSAEREDWWLGLIAIASLTPLVIFLAGHWRKFDAR